MQQSNWGFLGHDSVPQPSRHRALPREKPTLRDSRQKKERLKRKGMFI
jgi:hypothetical protein